LLIASAGHADLRSSTFRARQALLVQRPRAHHFRRSAEASQY
jgi:hypothetical protein